MSLEWFKNRKDIAWVGELKPREFGPPPYDEKPSSYRWRIFKRGFIWGKYKNNRLREDDLLNCGNIKEFLMI